ncbi:MAG: hypothetical protein E7667_03255 [Ruminococcaceae bacterium]|nr:hypothetical protein [Oscillospiraceae bacterium]
MPIGKDSITKRVAKVEPAKAEPAIEVEKEENIAPELVATTAAAPKKAPAKKASTAAKKPAATTAKKPSSTTAKKTPAKKDVVAEKLTPPAEDPKVATNVLSNIAPETVEAVIGHKEDEKYEKVAIGDNMPAFLL